METKEQQTLVIDINLTRSLAVLLTLALLTASWMAYLAWGQGKAAASGLQVPLATSAGMRQYYLTQVRYSGSQADTACSSGYHMASLWEIADPSNLKYNITLGATRDDSGQGPPAGGATGWVRTGYFSDSSTTPGLGNCNAWTSNLSTDRGTTAYLAIDWSNPGSLVSIWDSAAQSCSQTWRVWCVQNSVSARVYLPLVLRDYAP